MKKATRLARISFTKKIIGIFLISCLLCFVYLMSTMFFISFFDISGRSMEPTLFTGDNIIIDHPVLGNRIVNPLAALKGAEAQTRERTYSPKIRHNEIVVFNFPFTSSWQHIRMNLNTYYVKRCIGLPGDTVEIQNGFYIVNRQKGIAGHQGNQHRLSLRPKESFDFSEYYTFPYDILLKWNIKEFGPLYVPGHNSYVQLTPLNFLLYKTLIEWEQKKPLYYANGKIFLGDREIEGYCFQKNYYFMGGDHVEDSEDSRYWGLVPEEFIVGKALLILKSIDHDGKYRWDRFLKRIPS
ncbi:MAG: signal peptidase I [Odoribacter sp.]|nr:signal peptidase I [Odoribacter sp.]